MSDEADALRAEARQLRLQMARHASSELAHVVELLATELERRATLLDGHDEP